MTFYRRSQALAGILRRTVRRRQTLPASLSPLPLADALNIMRTKPNKTRGIAAAALRLLWAGSRRRSIHVRRPSLIFGRSPSFSPPFAAPAFATRRRLASGLGTPIFLCSRLNNLQIGNTLRLPFAHDDAIIQQIRFNGLTGGPQFAYRHRYRLHHGQSRGVGRPGSYHFSYI